MFRNKFLIIKYKVKILINLCCKELQYESVKKITKNKIMKAVIYEEFKVLNK